ncbi:MAG: metallophosphoesterase [Endomicrobium sp.]|jgi:Icc-related predicted phosphoesterase|nr:metallophosphoesterase [Endomicrobium sp.]
MRILAVSDIEDKSLERVIEKTPEKLKSVDYIFSCGDLKADYIEYVTDSLSKSLYYVVGNHFATQFYGKEFKKKHLFAKLYGGKGMRLHFGGIDMHGRIEVVGDYIIVGFGGAMRYNPGFFQFEEFEMEKLVRKVRSEIRVQRIKDFFLFRKRKELIVMSHAPVAGVHDKSDKCHKGFQCFRDFLFKEKPVLWLHGHIHFEGQNRRQETKLGSTLIANVYSSKIINIEKNKIKTFNANEL